MFFRRVFKNDNSQTFSAPANSRNNSGASNSTNNNSEGFPNSNGHKGGDGEVSGKKNTRRTASDEKPKGLTILQLTPLWEHIIRTRTLPEGLSINAMFEEFYERLHDPEWQVRQHALRVLVDVLSVMRQNSDMYISRLIVPLVENLGHSTPAVRKGALDAFKVYLGETRIPDTVIHEVINIGMDQKFTSDFGGRLAAGVILALPSLIQPTLISIKRAAILKLSLNALVGKMLQVTYQEVALKSIIKIRDMISQRDFMECMPFKAKRDFDILCNVYGLQGSPTSLRDSGIDLNVPSSSESKNSWQYYHRGQPVPNEMLPPPPPPPPVPPNGYMTTSNQDYENQLNLWKFNYVNQPQQQPPPLHIQLTQQSQPLLPQPLPPSQNNEIPQDTWQYKNLISKTNSIMEMRTENNENHESRKMKPKPPPIEQIEEMVMVESTQPNENYFEEISSMQMLHYSPPEVILNANPDPKEPEAKIVITSPVKSPKKGTPMKEKSPHRRPHSRNSHSAYQRKNKSPMRRSRSATPTPSPRPMRSSSAESFMKSASDTEGTEPDITLAVSSFFQRKESNEINPGDKIIMETEIKLSETTAVTMRILESQISQETEESEEEQTFRSSNKSLQRSDSIMRIFSETDFDNNVETDDATPRTPRRVRFGGEIIKMRTPDSDALIHSDADENHLNHSRASSNEPVKDKIFNIPIEKTQTLQIEITNDNTKPMLPVRPKTAASPSHRKYSTPNSDSTVASPTNHKSHQTRSPSRKEIDYIKPRSRSISPGKQKRRIQNRNENILSPLGQHHEVQVLHNLIRSPLISPTPVGRPIQAQVHRKNSITSVTSETQTDDTAKNSLSPVERGTVQTQTSIEMPSPKRTVDLVSISTSTSNGMVEPYINNNYDSNLRSGCLTQDVIEVKSKRWEELGLVDNETLADLKSGDWRLRSRAICAIEDALRDSDNLGKVQPCLESLLKTLLSSEKHSDVLDDKRRVIINLISRLPLDNLENRVGQLVTGLCRQGGAGSNRVAKTLMQRLPPAAIVLRLLSDEFVHARSARFRENALQMVLYALMTFPSTYFDISTCVRRATKAAIDRKKRVRQAALDVLAVLGQISSPKTVIEVVNSVVEHRQDGDHLTAAVKARLARKQLPIVGSDGSVQYTLRIPSPQSNMPTHVFGADVEWIIAGSGSVSPTSLTKRTINHTSPNVQPTVADVNRYLEYSNFNSSNNIINTSNRFGRRAPHEMLAIGVGVKNIDDKDVYTSGNWRKFTVYQADEEKNSQFIVATAQLSSTQKQQEASPPQQAQPPPQHQQQQQQQINITGAEPPQPLYNMKMQSRSVPELSSSGNTSSNKKNSISSVNVGNGNGRPSKIPVTMSRFPAMENNGNNGALKSSLKNDSMQNLVHITDNKHNPTIHGHPTIYKSFSVQKLNGIPPKSINAYNINNNNNNGNYGMRPESQGSLMKQSSLEETRLPSGTTSEYSMTSNQKGYFTSSKQGFQILSSNQYYQQNNEKQVTSQNHPDHQLKEKKSNRPSPEVLSNSTSRGSSSDKSSYNINNNNGNTPLSIHNDSNTSDVSTESDSDNSTPTRVIGTSDPVINVQKLENLIQQKSPSSISRPHSVLGSNKASIEIVDKNKRPKTANIINFDDIPIKTKNRSIENIPINEDRTSIKSETLSIDNIPFDEIPIKSKTSSRENVSNISRSSSIIQDPFRRIETPTPRDIDEISSNSVGTRSDTDYEDDTVNTKSKNSDISETLTPKSNGTAKSFNSIDMNSDKNEYNEMADDDFIKPTVKSPQRKLKPMIFRCKKVAPAKQAATQKAKQTETYTSSTLSRRFERPRDALNQCIIQLESQNWETTMNGIHLFLRLMRHHPEYIEPQIHVLAVHLAKHIKNLRSQVARAACQAAGEFFSTHRKYLDQETEDLVTNLLHRTADTNKFLRADAARALDTMIDNLPTNKIIHILTTRGTTHANAVVRTSTAKLLNRLVSRLGYDKVFALSKECRDKLILNTAQLLQEGSLETRNYAKDIFKQLSAHSSYSKVLFDVIPQRIYRNIEKTLKNIK